MFVPPHKDSIDVHLKHIFAQMECESNVSEVLKLIREGQVTVNGTVVIDPDMSIFVGDIIKINKTNSICEIVSG